LRRGRRDEGNRHQDRDGEDAEDAAEVHDHAILAVVGTMNSSSAEFRPRESGILVNIKAK
jgi:hypothetical protein